MRRMNGDENLELHKCKNPHIYRVLWRKMQLYELKIREVHLQVRNHAI